MEIVKNIKENDTLRNSFYSLAENTFGIDFKSWYDHGFWTDAYQPYVMAEDGRVISNVSVNHMTMVFEGRVLKLIQLGTVMTDKDYRGQGLSRKLMEEIMKEYEGKQDGIYLFANDSVLDFYPKFGFVKAQEYSYEKSPVTQNKANIQRTELSGNMASSMVRLSMENEKDWKHMKDIIAESRPFSRFGMADNTGLWMFYLSGHMKDCVYYSEKTETCAVLEAAGEDLLLHAYFSKSEVTPEQVMEAFGLENNKVTLMFTPLETKGHTVTKLREHDTTLFVKGMNIAWEKEKIRFQSLSHA